AATRCSTARGMWAAFAAAINWPDIAASAIDRPPEADPVIPASVVTLIAWLIKGLGIAVSASRIAMKPGSAAMTEPKPYSVAVLIDASKAPATAALLPSAKRLVTAGNAVANTIRMPDSKASSTAQIASFAATDPVSGWSRPASDTE